ncbi:MAG: nucleotidyltransferase domain-containing protein [Chloroflexi bacterium]|nr:nucleotidyltransferase domain-containing protein [Chloroflexota bacterium]
MQIFWLDRKATIRRLQAAVEALAQRYEEIEEVILFGSLARGEAAPGSDADLLVILRESDLPFLERSVRYRPAAAGLPVDVFAYRRAELEEMLANGNPLIEQALGEGISLFARRAAGEIDSGYEHRFLELYERFKEGAISLNYFAQELGLGLRGLYAELERRGLPSSNIPVEALQEDGD